MPNPKLRNQGTLLQVLGVVILLVGLRGFFVLKEDLAYLYFPGVAVAIIIFAVCLSRGGSLIRRSKE